MSKRTLTKNNRRIFEETGKIAANGKPEIRPTGEYMPAQARELVKLKIPTDRYGNTVEVEVLVSPGQRINPLKVLKRLRKEGKI